MKRICLLLAVSGLGLVACQKEQLSKSNSSYLVRSSENDTKWITIEDYNKKNPVGGPQKIGDDKGWKDCFYAGRDGNYVKGRTCENAQKHSCTTAAGCGPGTF